VCAVSGPSSRLHRVANVGDERKTTASASRREGRREGRHKRRHNGNDNDNGRTLRSELCENRMKFERKGTDKQRRHTPPPSLPTRRP
jgi:hypothetical protein